MINSIREEAGKLLHNRMYAIILFIIPIAANLLIGFVFHSGQIAHIPMAVVDYDRSGLSRTIIQQFAEEETFSLDYMLQDEEKLKAMLQSGDISVGMIIPGNFSRDVAMLKAPNILMIYDGSHMPVASTAKAKASEILLTLKTGAAMKLIGGKLGLPGDVAEKTALTIGFKTRFLYNTAKSYKYTLNPGLGAAVVQTAIVLLGAVCVNKDKLHGSFGRSVGYIAGKVVFFGLLGTASLMLGIFIQSAIFGVPFKGRLEAALLLSLLMATAEAACAVMISVWVSDTAFASLAAAVLFIPSTALGGYTWPIMSMPRVYQSASYLMPFAHYGDSLRSLYLKGIPLSVLLPELKWFGWYTAAAFSVAAAGVAIRNLPALTGIAGAVKGGKADGLC